MLKTAKIIYRWWWMWAIHAGFVWIMYRFMFFKSERWLRHSFEGLGLSFEMNYAVWWSGICLFLASIVYFRISEIDERCRAPWIVLGTIMVAL